MKKCIALILSVCMAVGFFPAFTVSAENSGYTIAYDMVTNDAYTFTRPYDMKSVTYADTKQMWRFHSTNSAKGVNVNSAYGLQAEILQGEWIALEINVPVGGVYDLEFSHGVAKSLGSVEGGLWILPGDTTDIAGALKEEAAIATDICYHDASQSKSVVLNTRSFENINLSVGKNLVVYKSLKADSAGKATIYPGKLVFTSSDASETVLMGLEGTLSRAIDPNGNKTAEINMVYYRSDGKKSDKSYLPVYKSENEEIAVVDAGGTVTAKSYGKTNIIATVENEAGHKIETQIPVSVIKQGYTISYDIAAGLTKIGAAFENSSFSGTRVLFTSLDDEVSNGFYHYHSSNGAKADGGTNSSNLNFREGAIQVGKDKWIAFEVFVPAPGTYTMEMYNATYRTYGDINVYMSQNDASVADEDKIGSYPCDSGVTSNTFPIVKVPNEIKNVEIPERGYYIFTFKATANYGFVGSFKLTSGDGLSALMPVEISGLESGLAEVSGFMSDGQKADLSRAQITWESSDESVAEINEYGYITEKNIGKTTITATVELGGFASEASKELEVAVQPEPPMDFSGVYEEYNFFDVSQDWIKGNGANNLKTDIRDITYEYTNESGNGNWAWFGASFTAGANTAWAYRSNGQTKPDYRVRLDIAKDQWVAFTLNVPEAGRYAVTYEYAKYNPSAGISEIYIIPNTKKEDVPAQLTKKNLWATVDYMSSKDKTFELGTQSMGIREFKEAGEYLIVFRQLSADKGAYITPRKLYLDGVNTFKFLTSEVTEENLTYMQTAQMSFKATLLDGTVLTPENYTVSYRTSDGTIATVDRTGLITAVGEGKATITARVKSGGITMETSVNVVAVDDTGVKDWQLKAQDTVYSGEKAKLSVYAIMNSGNRLRVPVENISFASSDGEVLRTDTEGMLTGLKQGLATVTVAAEFKGAFKKMAKEINVLEYEGKSEATYYTEKKREIARKNIKEYDWAKEIKDTTVTRADRRLEDWELLYELIPGEGIPRSRTVGAPNDSAYGICRYCGVNVVAKYGASGYGGFDYDVSNRPWKIQCPDCKRLFPSNDFESFYKLGLDEKGYFDRQRALDAHHAMLFPDSTGEAPKVEGTEGWYEYYGYGNPDGYLYNELYDNLADVKTLNGGKGLRETEKQERWGVDDGYGYIPRDKDGNPFTANKDGTAIERHCYIAYYHNNFWNWMNVSAITPLAEAYMYTGDIKYGRIGAVLLDRIADVYPSFNLLPWNTPTRQWMNTDGSTRYGKIRGRIDDCTLSKAFALACDAFYPALQDAQVINYLAEKGEKRGFDKSSSLKIWENWTKGILEETFDAAKTGKILGNYGMEQHALAAAAIILDDEPRTSEMIDWIYATNTGDEKENVVGGNLQSQLIDVVDRNGSGDEWAPYYNAVWIERLYQMADVLANYKGEKQYNPYENPKFAEMFMPYSALVLAESHHAQIADTGAVANSDIANGDAGMNVCGVSVFTEGFKYLKNSPYAKRLAQYIWLRNGKSAEGLNYGIFADNPESLKEEILALVDEDPEPISEMLTGTGFAVLRDGKNYTSASEATANNNHRDFWIQFGRNAAGHSQKDELHIGVEAYGLNISPDIGYPAQTSTEPQRLQWVNATIAHNTVVVDERNQTGNVLHGTPLHFDDSENVKLFDIDASDAYGNTESYRRSVIMIKVNDDISYGVDFFRVTGGKKHTYSFHALSDKVTAAQGLEMTAQNGGTYAGEDVEYGEDPFTKAEWNYETKYPRGYTWMTNVRRDTSPDNVIAADFEITDFRKSVQDGKGIHLRLTQLNDFTPSEVAFVGGPVPQKVHNAELPEALEYVLIHRDAEEGEKLDTLFTTVLEPYKNDRYISSIEPVEVKGKADANSVRAIKVTHTSGRVDYIAYALDNSVVYTVCDKDENGAEVFKFRGFAAVYSVNGDAELLRYVNDGDIISVDGAQTGTESSYTGYIKDYQRELAFENYIDVNIEISDVSKLAGKYAYIENDEVQNGVYFINSAKSMGEGTVRLDLGTTSLIRGHKNKAEPDDGYIYNIAVGQKVYIPMSFEENNSPVFDDIGTITTSAGSSIKVDINARSPITENAPSITYEGTTLPRGASINSETGVVTWKPDSSQVGDNHLAITARDSDGRESTVHFIITVYGSTTGGTVDR